MIVENCEPKKNKIRGKWRGLFLPSDVVLESVTYGGTINAGDAVLLSRAEMTVFIVPLSAPRLPDSSKLACWGAPLLRLMFCGLHLCGGTGKHFLIPTPAPSFLQSDKARAPQGPCPLYGCVTFCTVCTHWLLQRRQFPSALEGVIATWLL